MYICDLNTYIYILNHLCIVRLVNGSAIYNGIVEVQHNGTWGLVCSYGWDLVAAQVICSELGLGQATAAIQIALYVEDRTRIWLGYLSCIGTERTIGNCSHPGWGYYSYCYYGAGVRCSSGKVVYISCLYCEI